MSEYSDTITGHDQLGVVLCSLIKELLAEANIKFHSVDHRVKSEKSAAKKIAASPDKYTGIGDLTDLLGIRIITYFPTDVDKVAIVLEKEFKIDAKNSVDKRKLLEEDKFGYLSLHYIASLDNSRSKLVEYKRFANLGFEIQIRSILQHAWAEIEHDLGYKAEGSLPEGMRRSFSRLAGLLELADEEFERLRTNLDKYAAHANEIVKSEPQNLKVDQSTLVAVMLNEPLLAEFDELIAAAAGSTLNKEIDASYVGRQANQLKALGINDVDQLLKIANRYRKHIEIFIGVWLKDKKHEHKEPVNGFPRGVALFYICYILAAQKAPEELGKWNTKLRAAYPNILTRIHKAWDKTLELTGPVPKN